jgi:hypothetical protein
MVLVEPRYVPGRRRCCRVCLKRCLLEHGTIDDEKSTSGFDKTYLMGIIGSL